MWWGCVSDSSELFYTQDPVQSRNLNSFYSGGWLVQFEEAIGNQNLQALVPSAALEVRSKQLIFKLRCGEKPPTYLLVIFSGKKLGRQAISIRTYTSIQLSRSNLCSWLARGQQSITFVDAQFLSSWRILFSFDAKNTD